MGQKTPLTAGADTLNGTSGNDTFNALTVKADGSDGTTLSSFDAIDGGAGTDTLNIYTTNDLNNAFPAFATVKNVEIVNIFNAEGAANLGDASKFEGVTQLWQNGAHADVTNLAATTTAGFRGVIAKYTDQINVEAADAAASATIALDGVKGSSIDNVVNVNVEGLALNAVTISGTLAKRDAAGDAARLDLDIKAGKNVQTVSVNTTFDTRLSVSENGASDEGKPVKTVDASASTGAIEFDADDTVTTILTGSGNDDVTLNTALTSTVKAASVTTGAGNDTITVDLDIASVAAGSTVTVDAGAGNDAIYLTTNSNTKLTFNVSAGAGDDTVYLQDSEGNYRVLTDNDNLNGGDGIDTIVLAAPTDYVLTSGDYIRLQDLQNFEHLRFTGVVGTSTNQLNAADLTGYSQIEVTSFNEGIYEGEDQVGGNDILGDGEGDLAWADGSNSFVKGISASQTIVARGDAILTTAGYDSAAAATVKNDAAAVLTLKVLDSADIGIFAKSANITVDTTEAEDDVSFYIGDYAPSDIDSATITLVSTTDEDGEVDYVADVEVYSANAGAGFTSLTINGTGYALVDNTGGKLTTINTAGLGGVDVDGDAFAGLEFYGELSVQETVTVGSGIDDITIASQAGGVSLTKMDTITGLNLVLNTTGDDFAATSDVFTLDLSAITTTASEFVVKTFTTAPASLGAALNTVSAMTDNAVVFAFGGNTYLFVENEADGTTANTNFEASDFVVKLTGSYDLADLAVLAGVSLVS